MNRLAPALLGVVLAGCNCAQVRTDLAYRCEADGGCEGGLVCVKSENLCRPPPAVDAGNCLKSCAEAGKNCGLVEDGCGKLLPCGECAMPQSCGGGGVPHVCGACPNSDDQPDDDALDTNCDGIDGDASRAVFVDAAGGSDTNLGTRAAPVKTLTRALAIGRPQILISVGTYAGGFTLRGGASLHGGYEAASGWARTAVKSSVDGTLTLTALDAGVTLDRLSVLGSPSSAGAPSSVAVLLVDTGAAVRVRSCELTARAGFAGAAGDAGLDGLKGGGGQPGASGPDGGAPGEGGPNVCDSTVPIVDLIRGGRGGAGGNPAGLVDGAAGEPKPSGGAGGLHEDCNGATTFCNHSTPGKPGAEGAMGTTGDGGLPGDGLGTVDATGWHPTLATGGASGTAGTGASGGGGGGSLVRIDGSVEAVAGGGGGGAGAGGCGGLGGSPGGAGGASIALLLWSSSPALQNVVLATAAGGACGVGGPGGQGGKGGSGAPGGEGGTPADGVGISAAGGLGGSGGPGGAGGPGGPAGGGPSIGIWCEASTPTLSGVSYLLGAGGTGPIPGVRAERHRCP